VVVPPFAVQILPATKTGLSLFPGSQRCGWQWICQIRWRLRWLRCRR